MTSLSSLGFGPFFENQFNQSTDAGLVPARVAAEHRGAYEVWSEAGANPAQIAGRLRHEAGDAELPGVGDWVLLSAPPCPGGSVIIDRLLERRTVFVRGASGRETRMQVVAANVDLVFVVCGMDADFNVRRIERYLALVRAGGARPVVVLNKADLADDAAERIAEVSDRCPGVAIFPISALRQEGLAVVRAAIDPGQTAALVGSSGAGKSTLVNALLGEERMATGGVRERDGRGRHVTTHRQLVMLPGGGLLLDTPGMRELQLADADGLDDVFADIKAIAVGCRFGDCRHDTEPGCAVREAVESGELAADRLNHYRQLEREARAYQVRHDARLQKQAGREFAVMVEEAARMKRWKRGK